MTVLNYTHISRSLAEISQYIPTDLFPFALFSLRFNPEIFPAFSEWPDLTESDSDDSAVEAIVGNTTPGGDGETITRVDQSKSSPPQPPPATHLDNKLNIPEDNTAQRIMHLLTELGSSNLVNSPSFAERNFLHCPNCTGRILNV